MNVKENDIAQVEEKAEVVEKLRRVSLVYDIYENDDKVMLVADMPGVDKDALLVELMDGKLLVTAKRLAQAADYSWQEFSGVEYYSLFSLVEGLDRDKIEADYKDGVLRLSFDRKEAAKPQKIAIH